MTFGIARAPNATVVGVTHPGEATEVVSFDLEGRPGVRVAKYGEEVVV